jgi:hypothetical protein
MADVDQNLTDLIGFSRDAFDTAQASQGRSSRIQWLLAAIAIIAVFVPGERAAMTAATLSFLGAAALAWLGLRQQTFRRYGERVRRATLLAKGLGHELSNHEFRSIETAFEGDRDRAAAKADPGYYASALPAGEERLIENLYESAFWSADLYKHSAKSAWIRFGGMAIAVIIIIVATPPFLSGELPIILSHIVLVVMTILASREVFGDAVAYSTAHREVGLVMERLEALRAKTDKTTDLMLILGDYNSAVETAPMPQSGVYERRRDEISRARRNAKS